MAGDCLAPARYGSLPRTMAQAIANILALARRMFAHERLPEAPLQEPPRRSGPGALRQILGPESLPADPVAAPPPGRESVLGAILEREDLPEDPVPEPSPRRRAALASLLGPEALPEDPPGPRRAGGRWLAWLFAPERLD